MKKTIRSLRMVALALVGAIVTGCSSDDNFVDKPQTEKRIVTFTTTVGFDEAATTRALAENGMKTFAAGDQIAVIYKNADGNTVNATGNISTGVGTNSATFTVTLVDPASNGIVRYIYPAVMTKTIIATSANINDENTIDYTKLASQDGTLATLGSSFDLAVYDGTMISGALPASAILSNKLAICKFSIKEGATDITSSITNLIVKNGDNTYSVTREATSGPIYVAMQPVTTGDIKFYASKGKDLYTKTVSNKPLDANKLYPINVTMTKMDGAISGFFTINESGTKVFFSQGNLQAVCTAADGDANTQETWTWRFATNQWDYVGNAAANTSINGNGSVSTTGTVDLFGWSTSANVLGIFNSEWSYSGELYSGEFADWGLNSNVKAGIGSGWRTLTIDEWTYLFTSRIVNGGTGFGYGYTPAMSVNGNSGIVIYPDNYTGSYYQNGSEWSTFEAAGCVFLPEAGYRYSGGISSAGMYGDYWSSSSNDWETACHVTFIGPSGHALSESSAYRYSGLSVRLVHPVE